MTQPFRILQQAAKRLADSLSAAAKHTPESRLGGPLGEAATKLTGAGLEARREFLTGIDLSTGTFRSFEVRHVESVPLTDSNEKVIGVCFPAQQDDAHHWVRWARAERRISDSHYSTKETVITPHPDEGRVLLHFPGKTQAPWDSGQGRPPTYVIAHGSPDGETTVRIRPEGEEASTIVLDRGPAFGRILAANTHYRLSIEENSRKTVNTNCYGDSAAEETAAELWKAGIDTDVYAFKTKIQYWSYGKDPHIEVSTLAAVAHSPAEEALLTDPITHYAPPGRKIADET